MLNAAPTGRPALFVVQRDLARDRGDEYGVVLADRASQLWHRPPEEWEWTHATINEFGVCLGLYVDGDPEEIRDYHDMYGHEWPFDGWKKPVCDCNACVSRRAQAERAP